MTKIIDVCDFIYSRYSAAKEQDQGFRDRELILSRKDENGKLKFIQQINFFLKLEIENLYLNNHIDSNQNSEYAADDDLEAELNVN